MSHTFSCQTFDISQLAFDYTDISYDPEAVEEAFRFQFYSAYFSSLYPQRACTCAAWSRNIALISFTHIHTLITLSLIYFHTHIRSQCRESEGGGCGGEALDGFGTYSMGSVGGHPGLLTGDVYILRAILAYFSSWLTFCVSFFFFFHFLWDPKTLLSWKGLPVLPPTY